MIRYLFVLLATWQLMCGAKCSITVPDSNTLTNFITQSGKGTAKERQMASESTVLEEVEEMQEVEEMEDLQEKFNIKSEEGGVATLPCFANGYQPSSIRWRKEGIMLNTNQGRYVLTSTGDLQIVQVSRTDSGTYVCIADNGVGEPALPEVQLTVNVPVTVAIQFPQGRSFFVNDSFTINCTANGYPKPIVNWVKDGEVILPNGRINITDENLLIVPDSVRSDSGVYRCLARNEHSEAFQENRVRVYKPYYRPRCTVEEWLARCGCFFRYTCPHRYDFMRYNYCCHCKYNYLYKLE
uniref:Putative receptor mediating netrin-dependent axon guidance n=1 Tax=Anopheles braziliensis TaxID=58242 RepID=A0A2M3ZLM7_9DIPT